MRRFIFIIAILGSIVGIFLYKAKHSKDAAAPTTPNSFLSFLTPASDRRSGGSETDATDLGGKSSTATSRASTLKQRTTFPIAAFTAYTVTRKVSVPSPDKKQKALTETLVDHSIRFVARHNGYVYEIKNEEAPIQISNIYIPNIYEAYFADGNKTVVVRFLRDDDRTVATYSIPIPELNPDNTRTQKEGVYFPDGISALAISPDSKYVSYLQYTKDGSVVSVSNTANQNKKLFFKSPFREWLLQWQNKNIYVQTKALSSESGYLYRIDSAAKRLVRVLADIKGLTTSVSPGESYVLASESGADGFSTSILNTATGARKVVPAMLLPEKCSWMSADRAVCAGNEAVPSGQYPDDWYRGLISFKDKFYILDARIGLLTPLSTDADGTFDAINLSVDESQRLLYFMDKPTGYLWQVSY